MPMNPIVVQRRQRDDRLPRQHSLIPASTRQPTDLRPFHRWTAPIPLRISARALLLQPTRRLIRRTQTVPPQPRQPLAILKTQIKNHRAFCQTCPINLESRAFQQVQPPATTGALIFRLTIPRPPVDLSSLDLSSQFPSRPKGTHWQRWPSSR